MGVDSNEMAGGGVSGGGGTKVAVGVFWGVGGCGDGDGAGNGRAPGESRVGEAGESADGGPIPGWRGLVRMRGPDGARVGRSWAVEGLVGGLSSLSMSMSTRWEANANVSLI